MRKLLCCSLLSLAVITLVSGCSSSNPEAPAQIHPTNWYLLHRATTTSTVFATECGGCHVVKNLPGPIAPPGCFSVSFDGRFCHADGPGQAPHPLDGSFLLGSVHGKIAKADLTFCQACHSSNPAGGPGSNPRFNVGINNPLASASPGNGCEQCHGVNQAHPASWAGPPPNSTFHYSAQNIQAACTLCHGAALNGVGGVAGAVSCQDCHAETTDFTLNCTSCHGFPPDGVTVEPLITAAGGTLVNHRTVVANAGHDQCATCHGVKISGAGPTGLTGKLNPSANYLAFNKSTDAIGDHWDGKINMNGPSALDPSNGSGLNGGTRYNSTNFGCDLACHLNDTAHRLSDSTLPVAFGDYGVGAAPHAVGDNWLLLSQHATQAVNGPLNCVGCHTQTGGGIDPPCQGCHNVAPKMDLTNTGCPSCHSYPPDSVTPAATQPNRAGTHAGHSGFTAATTDCTACHQGGGSNSLTHYDRVNQTTPNYPAEVSTLAAYNAKSGAATYSVAAHTCAKISCHGGITTPNWYGGALPGTAPTVNNTYCLSCHVSGTAEYNGFSSGRHTRHIAEENKLCVDCHNPTVLQSGVGGVGPTHWSGLATQAFELVPRNTVGGGSTSVTSYDGTTCKTTCHGDKTW
jgi:hypothetical protein